MHNEFCLEISVKFGAAFCHNILIDQEVFKNIKCRLGSVKMHVLRSKTDDSVRKCNSVVLK